MKNKTCHSVTRKDKCIRGKNGNMLVRFGNKLYVVLARRLRKL